MPDKDTSHTEESASVQATPATPPVPGPTEPSPETPEPEKESNTVSNALHKMNAAVARLGAILSTLVLVASVACVSAPSSTNTAPSHGDAGSAQESAAVTIPDRPDWIGSNANYFHIGNPLDEATKYRVQATVAKCNGEAAYCDPGAAYEVVQADNNLLMTAGATQLWNCLSGGTCSTTLSTTNAQLAVGDSSTAAAAGQTDLQAAAGTKLNAADLTSCTNATPIVCSGTLSPAAVAGQVYQFAGFSGAGASAINNTFEASAGSGSSITLLNSAGAGAITVTGATVKPINYYRQQANASGSAVVSTNQITYVATFGTTNGNFAWNEWAVTTGAAATNKQAQAPPLMLNRAVPGGGLGTKTSAASWTLTVTLSLS